MLNWDLLPAPKEGTLKEPGRRGSQLGKGDQHLGKASQHSIGGHQSLGGNEAKRQRSCPKQPMGFANKPERGKSLHQEDGIRKLDASKQGQRRAEGQHCLKPRQEQGLVADPSFLASFSHPLGQGLVGMACVSICFLLSLQHLQLGPGHGSPLINNYQMNS